MIDLHACFDELVKMATGEPTRGGFYMASGIPNVPVPSLRAPLQKTGDLDYNYSPGDFKPVNLNARKKVAGLLPPRTGLMAHSSKVGTTPGVFNLKGPGIHQQAAPKAMNFHAGLPKPPKMSFGAGSTPAVDKNQI